MNKISVILFGIAVLVSSCSSAKPIQLVPGALDVKVAKGDPPDNFREVGQVTAQDGQGCGLYGFRGTYERAIIDLKNKAYALGGEYIQIMTLTEPHLRGECFDNNYIISGVAYKKARDLPSPISIVTPPSENAILIERLRLLKQLKDEGLITEQQYREKQGQTLK
jgi:hypothetical protein